MARMQKMPVSGKITDKMKKQPMPNRPMPKGAEPKQYKGTQLNKLKQAAVNAFANVKKAGPAGPRNKKAVPGQLNRLQGFAKANPGRGRPGTNKGGGKLPNFKGVMAPRKQPITRPVQPPRRGSR